MENDASDRRKLSTNSTGDARDPIDAMVDNLVDRAQKVWALRADMEYAVNAKIHTDKSRGRPSFARKKGSRGKEKQAATAAFSRDIDGMDDEIEDTGLGNEAPGNFEPDKANSNAMPRDLQNEFQRAREGIAEVQDVMDKVNAVATKYNVGKQADTHPDIDARDEIKDALTQLSELQDMRDELGMKYEHASQFIVMVLDREMKRLRRGIKNLEIEKNVESEAGRRDIENAIRQLKETRENCGQTLYASRILARSSKSVVVYAAVAVGRDGWCLLHQGGGRFETQIIPSAWKFPSKELQPGDDPPIVLADLLLDYGVNASIHDLKPLTMATVVVRDFLENELSDFTRGFKTEGVAAALIEAQQSAKNPRRPFSDRPKGQVAFKPAGQMISRGMERPNFLPISHLEVILLWGLRMWEGKPLPERPLSHTFEGEHPDVEPGTPATGKIHWARMDMLKTRTEPNGQVSSLGHGLCEGDTELADRAAHYVDEKDATEEATDAHYAKFEDHKYVEQFANKVIGPDGLNWEEDPNWSEYDRDMIIKHDSIKQRAKQLRKYKFAGDNAPHYRNIDKVNKMGQTNGPLGIGKEYDTIWSGNMKPPKPGVYTFDGKEKPRRPGEWDKYWDKKGGPGPRLGSKKNPVLAEGDGYYPERPKRAHLGLPRASYQGLQE